MDPRGKVAIVTGASSGVGWEVAVRLAEPGVRVVINDAHTLSGAEATPGRSRTPLHCHKSCQIQLH